jgi:hypothetical protein
LVREVGDRLLGHVAVVFDALAVAARPRRVQGEPWIAGSSGRFALVWLPSLVAHTESRRYPTRASRATTPAAHQWNCGEFASLDYIPKYCARTPIKRLGFSTDERSTTDRRR